MNGLKLFPIHIILKDLSFIIFYWLLVKYVFNNSAQAYPNAESSFSNILFGALYYNIATLILSCVLYLPIVYLIKKLKFRINLQLILTGLILTSTTPVFYMYLQNWKHNNYYQSQPEYIAWFLCFIASTSFYYLVNKPTLKKEV